MLTKTDLESTAHEVLHFHVERFKSSGCKSLQSSLITIKNGNMTEETFDSDLEDVPTAIKKVVSKQKPEGFLYVAKGMVKLNGKGKDVIFIHGETPAHSLTLLAPFKNQKFDKALVLMDNPRSEYFADVWSDTILFN